MDYDYVPFKDYLSLSTVAWNQDLITNLNSLIPHCGNSSVKDDGLLLGDNLIPRITFDSLDDARCNALEEFKKNGVEKEMDEIDKYQHQIREVRSLAPENSPAHYYQSGKGKKKSTKCCVFCKNNGELSSLFRSHVLKDGDGKITCPVLRRYTCPLCGQNGDSAHTIRYCPKNTNGASPGLLLFLNSTRDSAGRLKIRK